MSAPNNNQGAPEYKPNPSMDGTTVNNGAGINGNGNGKSQSPTNSSEEHDPYVTDETPRSRRAAGQAPPPGVMVSLANMIYMGRGPSSIGIGELLLTSTIDCPALAKERVSHQLY